MEKKIKKYGKADLSPYITFVGISFNFSAKKFVSQLYYITLIGIFFNICMLWACHAYITLIGIFFNICARKIMPRLYYLRWYFFS